MKKKGIRITVNDGIGDNCLYIGNELNGYKLNGIDTFLTCLKKEYTWSQILDMMCMEKQYKIELFDEYQLFTELI